MYLEVLSETNGTSTSSWRFKVILIEYHVQGKQPPVACEENDVDGEEYENNWKNGDREYVPKGAKCLQSSLKWDV